MTVTTTPQSGYAPVNGLQLYYGYCQVKSDR